MSNEPDLPPPSSCPVNHQKWSVLGGRSSAPTTDSSTQWTSTPPPPPSSVEEAARYAQTPQPNQRTPLGTDRQVSSIPRSNDAAAAAYVPAHQSTTAEPDRWVYPSEQQIYNAMIRKGHRNIPEESIPTVLQIHNGINENTWQTIIRDWENGDTCRLDRFEGRPRDLSPKAYLLTKIWRKYDPPFDRHDWYVSNQRTGTVQRYVIDYYSLPTSSSSAVVPYVDVRPAVDNPYGVYLRSRRFIQLAFPGISTLWKQYWQR